MTQRDPLDMTLREFITSLSSGLAAVSSPDDWVNIRDDARYPWRHIVAAAERGECQVSRVGRKLLMQRAELDKFLSTRRIVPRREPENDAPHECNDEVAVRALRELGVKR